MSVATTTTTTTTAAVAQLPPRKRARTEEEKEQRRVERIIRNRRAAHASREKKRRHVETLEQYVQSLEDAMEFNKSVYNKLMKLIPDSNQLSSCQFQTVDRPVDLSGKDTKLNSNNNNTNNNNNNNNDDENDEDENDYEENDDNSNDDNSNNDDIDTNSNTKKRKVVMEEDDNNEKLNIKQEINLGLLSPPSSNPGSVFKLPEESILKQNFISLFDEDNNTNDNDNNDLTGSLSIHNEQMGISLNTLMVSQETNIMSNQESDPLYGLFDSVHPAVMQY